MTSVLGPGAESGLQMLTRQSRTIVPTFQDRRGVLCRCDTPQPTCKRFVYAVLSGVLTGVLSDSRDRGRGSASHRDTEYSCLGDRMHAQLHPYQP